MTSVIKYSILTSKESNVMIFSARKKKCVFNQIDTMQINIHFNSYAHKVLVHIKIPGHGKTERV